MNEKIVAQLLILLLALSVVATAGSNKPKETLPEEMRTGPKVRWATVKAKNVACHAGPGGEYPIVGTYTVGHGMEVLGENDGWYKVRRYDHDGDMWVWKDFVDLS